MAEEKQNNRKQESLEAKDYFEQYWRYCAALRNWFVAYGIGGSILFISDKAKVFQDLTIHTKAKVVIAFLIGVIAQIVLALINKWIHWYIYRGVGAPGFCQKWYYKLAVRLSSCFWIDILADIITFIAFGFATVTLILALLY